MNVKSAASVAWWPVHQYAEPVLNRIVSWPMVGTPEWCGLAEDDPRRIAAIFDAARHWALRIETCQHSLAEASKAVAAAIDWKGFARREAGRRAAYIERQVS